jgi:hypothetical protein
MFSKVIVVCSAVRKFGRFGDVDAIIVYHPPIPSDFR